MLCPILFGSTYHGNIIFNPRLQEVSVWFDHLKTVVKNHQRGARKAAETRRLRKQLAGQAEQGSAVLEKTINERQKGELENQDLEEKNRSRAKNRAGAENTRE